MIEERLVQLSSKKTAIDSTPEIVQEYIYNMRYKLDTIFGKHARILAYRNFVDDSEFTLDLQYVSWLFGELILS